ncbi:MAG: hypothetical protein SPF31_04640, partial [Lactobacillus delbrueckii]|nr:hypothetical protein [Lactobacillus delbrueckii]
QSFHFPPPEVHARGYIAITSSIIEYLLVKLLSFQGFIVLFGVGSLSNQLLRPEETILQLNTEHFSFSSQSSYLVASLTTGKLPCAETSITVPEYLVTHLVLFNLMLCSI